MKSKRLMKAVVCSKYGPPEVLEFREVPMPVCRDNELLVKVMATTVNSGDVRVRSLKVSGLLKIIMRLVLGFNKPRNPILGIAFAGVVEAVGCKVSKFKVGEKVFGITGFRFGAFAAYLSIKEDAVLTTMPANASFEEAAALSFGVHTTFFFLQKAGIEAIKNPKVLIYGATGSVGIAAVQYACYFQAAITAVCSSNGRSLVSRFEVEEIICYDQQDFSKTNKRFDIIFDAVGKISRKQCRHLLVDGGRFVTVGGLTTAIGKVAQLEFVRKLFENNAFDAVIDKVFAFDDMVAAHRYVDGGSKKGNVVINQMP